MALLVVCVFTLSQVRLVCWCLLLIAPGPRLRGAGGCFLRHRLFTWLARSSGCGLWPKDAINFGRRLLPAVMAVRGWWSVAVLIGHANSSFVSSLRVCVLGYRDSDDGVSVALLVMCVFLLCRKCDWYVCVCR